MVLAGCDCRSFPLLPSGDITQELAPELLLVLARPDILNLPLSTDTRWCSIEGGQDMELRRSSGERRRGDHIKELQQAQQVLMLHTRKD